MSCEHVELPGGATAVVCSRGKRAKRCSTKGCSRPATKLCDFTLRGRKAGKTCDAALCERCAVVQSAGVDYCPPHARGSQQTRPRRVPPVEPVSPSSKKGRERLERLRNRAHYYESRASGGLPRAWASALRWAFALLDPDAEPVSNRPCFHCNRWAGDLEVQRIDELEAELSKLRSVVREGLGQVGDEQLVAALRRGLAAEVTLGQRVAELEAQVAKQLTLGGVS